MLVQTPDGQTPGKAHSSRSGGDSQPVSHAGARGCLLAPGQARATLWLPL